MAYEKRQVPWRWRNSASRPAFGLKTETLDLPRSWACQSLDRSSHQFSWFSDLWTNQTGTVPPVLTFQLTLQIITWFSWEICHYLRGCFSKAQGTSLWVCSWIPFMVYYHSAITKASNFTFVELDDEHHLLLHTWLIKSPSVATDWVI